MPLLIHSAMTALHCYSDRSGWAFWTTRHAARSVVAACFSAEYRRPSLGPRSMRSRMSLAAVRLISVQISGGVHEFDGGHLIAMRIEIGAIAQWYADDAEPACLDRGRGNIDLGAVEPDQGSALGFGKPELFALGIGHWREGVEQPGSVPVGAGAASAVGISAAWPYRPCAHVAAGRPRTSYRWRSRARMSRHRRERCCRSHRRCVFSPADRSRRLSICRSAMNVRNWASNSPGTTLPVAVPPVGDLKPVGVRNNRRRNSSAVTAWWILATRTRRRSSSMSSSSDTIKTRQR